jgi:hypothetical protein
MFLYSCHSVTFYCIFNGWPSKIFSNKVNLIFRPLLLSVVTLPTVEIDNMVYSPNDHAAKIVEPKVTTTINRGLALPTSFISIILCCMYVRAHHHVYVYSLNLKLSLWDLGVVFKSVSSGGITSHCTIALRGKSLILFIQKL